jgi:protease-4
MTNPIDRLVKTLATSYVVIAIVALLVGAAVAPAVHSAVAPTTEEPDYVAVVTLDQTIYGSTADATIEELRDVRENDSIEAVVLQVDSPGGAASASEAQYMAVKRLAAEKPVVTAVRGMAASGMYYTILPTEHVFATPASLVGNVGVRTSVPPGSGVPSELTTGPDKLTGGTAAETRARVRTLKNAFVGTVMAERGEDITLSREEVAHGKIYSGAKAVQNGYADEIGDTEAAVKKAASIAGLSEYQIADREPATTGGFILFSAEGSANSTVVQEQQFEYEGVDTVHYLMLYGTPEYDNEVTHDGR